MDGCNIECRMIVVKILRYQIINCFLISVHHLMWIRCVLFYNLLYPYILRMETDIHIFILLHLFLAIQHYLDTLTIFNTILCSHIFFCSARRKLQEVQIHSDLTNASLQYHCTDSNSTNPANPTNIFYWRLIPNFCQKYQEH